MKDDAERKYIGHKSYNIFSAGRMMTMTRAWILFYYYWKWRTEEVSNSFFWIKSLVIKVLFKFGNNENEWNEIAVKILLNVDTLFFMINCCDPDFLLDFRWRE